MSIVFTSSPKVNSIPRHLLIQKMLEENHFIIKAIKSYLNRGKSIEVHKLLQVLHRNIILLGSITDEISSSSISGIPDSSNSSVQQSSMLPTNEASHDPQITPEFPQKINDIGGEMYTN